MTASRAMSDDEVLENLIKYVAFTILMSPIVNKAPKYVLEKSFLLDHDVNTVLTSLDPINQMKLYEYMKLWGLEEAFIKFLEKKKLINNSSIMYIHNVEYK